MHADHTSLADGGTSGEDFYGTLIMYCYYYCIFSVFFNNHVVYTLSIGLLYKLLIVIINLNKFRVVQKIPHKVYSTVTLQPRVLESCGFHENLRNLLGNKETK